MLLDALSNLDRYGFLKGSLGHARSFLLTRDLRAFPEGRTNILGDDVYLLVQRRDTKRSSEEPFEVHRRYVDIHIPLEGEEWLGYAPVTEGTQLSRYDENADRATFWESGIYLRAVPGMFYVFFPQDGHKTCITMEARTAVRKIVVKAATTP